MNAYQKEKEEPDTYREEDGDKVSFRKSLFFSELYKHSRTLKNFAFSG